MHFSRLIGNLSLNFWYLNTIKKLSAKGIVPKEINKSEIREIVDRWYFPLYTLDIKEKKVDEKELKEIQEKWRP